MDVRQIFNNASQSLILDFEKSAANIKHKGGRGSVREETFKQFLGNYLPKRYSVGKGEVFNSQNRISGELDVILYDEQSSPRFLYPKKSHTAYPIESVYGAISVKSDLTSNELKIAYRNIKSLKEIALSCFRQRSNGLAAPVPITGIFAYSAKRSLDSIVKQVLKLDNELPDIALRPDFVAILNSGIIGPDRPLRGASNEYRIPEKPEDRACLQKSGRHTLFVLSMDLYRELGTIILDPFDFTEYHRMPRLIGEFRVAHPYIFRREG